MKLKLSLAIISLLVLSACKFDKSYNKDLISGLTTTGNGLSCDDVFLSVGTNQIKRNSFVYGEKFELNFNNITGFNKEGTKAFPGMKILITASNGDTIMQNKDLYANYKEGFDLSPLLLKSIVTAANPVHSNNTYKLNVNIWDKKGYGTYKAELDFDVVHNDKMIAGSEGVSYKELYLFSQDRQEVIVDHIVDGGKDTFVLFEGLDGFKDNNGDTYIGVSMSAIDSDKKVLVNEIDLMGDSPFKTDLLKKQLAPIFTFPKEGFTNPIQCDVLIWDKTSESKIKTSFKVNIQ